MSGSQQSQGEIVAQDAYRESGPWIFRCWIIFRRLLHGIQVGVGDPAAAGLEVVEKFSASRRRVWEDGSADDLGEGFAGAFKSTESLVCVQFK